MPPGFKVVKRIEDDSEGFEPVDVELGIFNVRVMGFELDVGVELLSDFFGYLELISALVYEEGDMGGAPEPWTS
jgi:hypothetical protein